MMNPVPWLQMTNMISYQGLVRTFPSFVGKCVKDAAAAEPANAKAAQCEKAAADKKLTGAAKNSFIQKCVKTDGAADKATQCEKAAADKKLAGAAKNSFIQKCVKTA